MTIDRGDFSDVRLVDRILPGGRRAKEIVVDPPASVRLDVAIPTSPFEYLRRELEDRFRASGERLPDMRIISSREPHSAGIYFRIESPSRRPLERKFYADADDLPFLIERIAAWVWREWAGVRWLNRIGTRERLRRTIDPPAPRPYRHRLEKFGGRRAGLRVPVIRFYPNECRPCP